MGGSWVHVQFAVTVGSFEFLMVTTHRLPAGPTASKEVDEPAVMVSGIALGMILLC
jgi:hypothetical protein